MGNSRCGRVDGRGTCFLGSVGSDRSTWSSAVRSVDFQPTLIPYRSLSRPLDKVGVVGKRRDHLIGNQKFWLKLVVVSLLSVLLIEPHHVTLLGANNMSFSLSASPMCSCSCLTSSYTYWRRSFVLNAYSFLKSHSMEGG